MAKRDDRELVKKCIEGSAEAWGEFVDRFSGLVNWAIKRKLNKYNCAHLMSDVEDIYQRLFASIWEKKSLISVSERGNITPWLIVIASNATIDYIRKRGTEKSLLRKTAEIETVSRDEESDIFVEANKRLLDEAMKLLNEKERAYLESCYIAGKKQREIAEIFNISINSVSTIIARAKNKIKKYIESKKI